MARTRAALLAECQKRLLKTKQDLMNGLQASRAALRQLREIDAAMGRIEDDEYGICEETEEPIEEERLLALPWTRLSVEGAELRDRRKAKFA